MSDVPGMRAFAVRGESLAEALDWLHVHADLQGVLEQDDVLTVWLVGDLPRPPVAGLSIEELAIDPADYAITGLEHDRAIQVATDLLVRPPWVERPAGFEGIELVVPRGGAFGSGEHDSTQAALRCLHRVWDAPASFADIGTGSGILLLYAQQRGCRGLAGCDIDAASVEAARELLPGAVLHLGGPDGLPACDGVVANMTGSELTAAMPAILRCWTGRSALVLSGLRANEVETVTALVPARVGHREVVGAFTSVAYPGAAGAVR
ncbi:MAG: 50S ribosomal protein L11 methyltransferase [Planctomycetota bacterium]